jgi:hypothetical protein
VSDIDPTCVRVVTLRHPGAPIAAVPLFLPPAPAPIGAVLDISLRLLALPPHACQECGVGLCLVALIDAYRDDLAMLHGCRGRIDAPRRPLDWLPRRHRYWGRIDLEAPGDTLIHRPSGERVYDLHAAAAAIGTLAATVISAADRVKNWTTYCLQARVDITDRTQTMDAVLATMRAIDPVQFGELCAVPEKTLRGYWTRVRSNLKNAKPLRTP